MKNIIDESWRTITQTPRRSTTSGEHPFLAEDFSDVFGGPPRTILSHQFATRFSVSSSSRGLLYEDIFRQPQKAAVAVQTSGRNLPRFRIPTGKQRSFDSSIFGWDDESVLRSKTSSSSALSSDDDHSFFAPKLRPINVGNSTRTDPGKYEKSTIFNYENDFLEKLSNYQESFGVCEDDDLHLNSPSSDVSSVSHSDREIKTCENANAIWRHEFVEDEDEDEEDDNESVCSHVIEINSRNREWTCEPNGVDEAIAWAKEKFQTHCSEEKHTKELVNEHQLSKEQSKSFQPMIQVEMQIQEKKILLWLTGKEDDIRLLLSSLHQILWNNSGWVTISPMNITENSQVKRAYQKAQLCLHPDKLQQRGATVPQKYIAEKVFSALQDAWTAFLS